MEQLLNKETQNAMAEAIESFPAEFRQVFVLRDIEELSNAEVADILDLSVAAVKSRLHRARLKIRNRLAHVLRRAETAARDGSPAMMTCKEVLDSLPRFSTRT